MKQISLTLPYPISANTYWQTRVMGSTSKGGRPMATTYIGADAKLYKRQVLALVRAAGIAEPIRGRVQLEIWLYPNRPLDWQKRQRQHGAAWDDTVRCLDLDNCHKVLLDCLKDLVIEDDAWVRRIASQRMEPDAAGARVVVRITAIESKPPQGELLETP